MGGEGEEPAAALRRRVALEGTQASEQGGGGLEGGRRRRVEEGEGARVLAPGPKEEDQLREVGPADLGGGALAAGAEVALRVEA